jgi:20S proteasome subunit alpha 1
MPVHVLAKRMADLSQVSTQKASYRAMAVSTILIGVDDEKGPQVFKLDAAGHYLPYKAVATGKLEAEAMNFLEKRAAEFPNLDKHNTVEMAISAMQYILSTDFKATEIEVGVISMEDGNQKFHVLTSDEVEERLTAITDKTDS